MIADKNYLLIEATITKEPKYWEFGETPICGFPVHWTEIIQTSFGPKLTYNNFYVKAFDEIAEQCRQLSSHTKIEIEGRLISENWNGSDKPTTVIAATKITILEMPQEKSPHRQTAPSPRRQKFSEYENF